MAMERGYKCYRCNNTKCTCQAESGITRCLKCQKDFKSKDRVRLRICPNCKQNQPYSLDKYLDVHVTEQ